MSALIAKTRRKILQLLRVVLTASVVSVHAGEPDGTRVVAIGDVHGDYQALVSLLQEIELLDDRAQWKGGSTQLVSLGDLLDRGPDSRKVMDLFRVLESSARSAGGRVHVLLGNHEIMNLTGNTRDVSAEEFAAFGGVAEHAAAFSPRGKYGAWLQSKPAALQLHGTLFLHGGLSQQFRGVAETNRAATSGLQAMREVATATELGALFELEPHQYQAFGASFVTAIEDPVFGSAGPFWYRGNARCHPHIEGPDVTEKLQALGVERVVVGHTPTATREIVRRFGGKVWVIDTGMLAAVYRGRPRALELVTSNGDTVVRALPSAQARITDIDQLLADRADAQYQALLKGVMSSDGERLSVTLAKQHHEVEFVPLGRAKRNQAMAAYIVDRALELGLVDPIAIREFEGRHGIIRVVRATVAERDRDFVPTSDCYGGSKNGSEFDLVSVFDSLIGKRDRSADNLHYDQRTHVITLVENDASFSTKSSLPAYAKQPTLSSTLAIKLKRLDESTLTNLLTGILKPAQIKGILKRRDKILQWEHNES